MSFGGAVPKDGKEGFGEGACVVAVGVMGIQGEGCVVRKGIALHGVRGAGRGARALARSVSRSQDLWGKARGGEGVGMGMDWE